jgi:hypothetical protein
MDFMRNVVYDAAKTTIYGPPGSAEDANAQPNASSRHPIAFIFHLLFKCSAFALYFFGSLFGMNVTVMYVATILLLAFDFWTVKVRFYCHACVHSPPQPHLPGPTPTHPERDRAPAGRAALVERGAGGRR